jgi:phosphosulfolactate phosphohydrolase-like enzyme
MNGERRFKIDAFADSAFRYLDRDAIVCVDIITCTSTIVNAVAEGRRIFPAADIDTALTEGYRVAGAALAGEVDGLVPLGFALGAGPTEVSQLAPARPVVLLSPGTRLLVNAAAGRAAYVTSFRNISATAAHLAASHERVVILGAGVGGEFRCEDQMASAMLGRVLVGYGFEPEDVATSDLVARWSGIEPELIRYGKSAAELRRGGREADLESICTHFDDLRLVCRMSQGEVVGQSASEAQDAVPSVRAVGEWWGAEWGVVVPFGPGTPPAGRRDN